MPYRKLLHISATASLGLSLASFALLVSNARLFPQVGTDSLIYHLTIPAHWLQRGFLAPLDLPFHDSAAEHGPLVTHAIHYVLLRFRGDDSLCWLVQPAFFLLTLRCVYLSCRLLGATRTASAALCGLLTFFPPFLTNIAEANNDHALVCGAAWMLYGVLRCQVDAQRGTVHAIAGGALLLASKHVGVIYAAAGLPLIVWAAWRRRSIPTTATDTSASADNASSPRCAGPPRNAPPRGSASHSWRQKAYHILMAIWLLLCTSFYARNLVSYSNPLYPATVKLLGITLLPGLYDPTPLMDHGWKRSHLWHMLVRGDAATDVFAPRGWRTVPLWAAWLLVAGVWALRRAALLASKQWRPSSGRRSGIRSIRCAVAVAFPAIAILLYFWRVPFWREHRLLFPVYYSLWLSAAAATAVVLRSLARRSPWHHLPTLCLFALLVWNLGVSAPERVRQVLLTAELAKRAGALNIRRERYEAQYAAQGRAWNLLRDLTRESPTAIAYSGTAIVFPLFGETLRNRVEYAPLSANDVKTPINLKPGESLYLRLAQARRQETDPAHWLQQLNARGIQYLYLVDDPARGGVAQELEIVTANPERFRLLLHADNVWVYRVRPLQ